MKVELCKRCKFYFNFDIKYMQRRWLLIEDIDIELGNWKTYHATLSADKDSNQRDTVREYSKNDKELKLKRNNCISASISITPLNYKLIPKRNSLVRVLIYRTHTQEKLHQFGYCAYSIISSYHREMASVQVNQHGLTLMGNNISASAEIFQSTVIVYHLI